MHMRLHTARPGLRRAEQLVVASLNARHAKCWEAACSGQTVIVDNLQLEYFRARFDQVGIECRREPIRTQQVISERRYAVRDRIRNRPAQHRQA